MKEIKKQTIQLINKLLNFFNNNFFIKHNKIIILVFAFIFMTIGYILCVLNPIYLQSIRGISDFITLFILGYAAIFVLCVKNISYRFLVGISVVTMLMMYVLYDVFDITTKYPISATGFNFATSVAIITLLIISKK